MVRSELGGSIEWRTTVYNILEGDTFRKTDSFLLTQIVQIILYFNFMAYVSPYVMELGSACVTSFELCLKLFTIV